MGHDLKRDSYYFIHPSLKTENLPQYRPRHSPQFPRDHFDLFSLNVYFLSQRQHDVFSCSVFCLFLNAFSETSFLHRLIRCPHFRPVLRPVKNIIKVKNKSKCKT